jgi:protein-S-isoprenylcysteine O-methyltransferase Ste14
MKLKNDDSPQGFGAKVFAFVTYAVIGSSLLYVFGGTFYEYLVPIPYLEANITLKWIGFFISLVAMVWIFMAQLNMHDSWRIGIDYDEKTSLITGGLFSISRNPIFLGMLVAYVGFFLLMPNALSFGLGLVSYVSISTQIRLEEEFLLAKQGKKYAGYKDAVNRWIGCR